MAVTTGPRAHGMVRQVAAVLRGEGNTRDGTYVRRLGGKVGAAVDAMPHIAVNEADVPLSAAGQGRLMPRLLSAALIRCRSSTLKITIAPHPSVSQPYSLHGLPSTRGYTGQGHRLPRDRLAIESVVYLLLGADVAP